MRFFLLLLYFSCVWASSTTQNYNPSTLQKYNIYLNSLQSLKASLTQISPKNTISKGTLYLQKPGKFRLIYEPAKSVELIADGTNLIQYDWRNQDSDSISLKDTPFYFLLSKGNLEELTSIQEVIPGKKWTQIILRSKEDPEAGTIKLVFQESPLQLIRWVFIDNQGNKTVVTLSNIHINIPINPKTFKVHYSH